VCAGAEEFDRFYAVVGVAVCWGAFGCGNSFDKAGAAEAEEDTLWGAFLLHVGLFGIELPDGRVPSLRGGDLLRYFEAGGNQCCLAILIRHSKTSSSLLD
jgi:hypothetical protein